VALMSSLARRHTPTTTSAENVEIVRGAYKHFNRTGERNLAIFHPDLVYHPRTDELDPRTHIGPA
jgi:hypothetical protein